MEVTEAQKSAWKQELVERVAEEIYRYQVCEPEEYEEFTGKPMRVWRTDAPWDTNPNELREHERDDYRRMAMAAMKTMREVLKEQSDRLEGK